MERSASWSSPLTSHVSAHRTIRYFSCKTSRTSWSDLSTISRMKTFFMLLEHIEGQSGAKCYMLEAPLETALITASDGEYGDDQSVAEIIGHGRLVHNIHVRRILYHNRLGL